MWKENVLALDLETTSANPRAARIIEIALSDPSGWEWDTLVDPEMDLPSKIVEVTGIQTSDLAGAPKLSEVLPFVIEKMRDKAIVAHNGVRYDAIVLACEAQRLGIAIDSITVVDTLPLARRVWATFPRHDLGTIVEQLGISHGRLHGALTDAKCCLEILERVVKECGASTLDDILKFQTKPRKMGPTVGFGQYRNVPWSELPDKYMRWYCFKCESPDPDIVEHMKTLLASRATIMHKTKAHVKKA